jgi:Flp pilus assembly protein TadD
LTYVLFVSVLAYLHARAVRMRAPGRPFALPSRLARVALPVCAIGLAALLWLDTRAVLACAALEHALLAAADAKPVAAGAQGSIASDPLTQRNAALALQRDWFLRAIAYRSFGTREAREQFALTATRLLSSGNDPWVRDNLAPPALDGIATLASRHRDMRDQLFLGDLLVALGRNEDAIPPFERALAMAPRRQSIYVMLAIADYRQGDTATARNLLRQAFDLDPTYDTVRLTFAASAIASGDEELGSRLLRERYGTALVPDDRIIAAYSAIGRFDTVAALWRIKVESEPGNASYRMQLVGALMRAGQAPEAMKELGKINPAMRRKAGAERAK